MYGEQQKIDSVIQEVDILIAGVDNYRYMYKLMNKSREFTKPLLMLDIENLGVSTHAVIPTGNVDDIIEYKELLKKKMNIRKETLQTESIKFPYNIIQCSTWAGLTFNTIFSDFYNSLHEFMENPVGFIDH